MGYRPPTGIRPPQLEGKRSGRPRGSKSHAKIWNDVLWGYHHRFDAQAAYPNEAARMWWSFARYFPDEVEGFLEMCGQLK
jgi:hypothetical protein